MCDYKNLKFPSQTWRPAKFALRIIRLWPTLLATAGTESVIPLIIDSLLLFVYDVVRSGDIQSHVTEYCNLIGLHWLVWRDSDKIYSIYQTYFLHAKWGWLVRLTPT